MSATAEAWVMVILTEDADDTVYLASYDVDAHDGRGDIVFTQSLERAKKFASFIEVMEERNRVSRVHPVRLSDGKPNRPLSAFTISPRRITP